MAEFLERIGEIQIVLHPSSWGRLQCNAKYYDAYGEGEKYHSWTGRPDEKVTMQMIIDAINSIDEQIKEGSKLWQTS